MSYVITPGAAGSSPGGGGTGGLGAFVTPPLAGWTWTNQGTSTVTTSANNDAFTLVKPANGANAINFSLYTRPLPASRRVSAAFRALVAVSQNSGQIPSGGMCLLESGTGKFVVVSLLVDGTGVIGPGIWARKYTNVTTFSADYLTSFMGHWQDLTRIRMYNGSAGVEPRTAEWGLDGEIWLPQNLINTTWNDFCVPDRIGFALDGYGFAGNTTLGAMVKVLSWDES